MMLEMLQGKLHRGVITDCRIDYMGSLTVDVELLERIGLREWQKIQLLNISNGSRLETYLIAGERGKREIIVNGAAARLNQKGDRIIVAGFAFLDQNEVARHRPKVLVLDERNNIVEEH
jgi:aspartate 1-decarboxylase